MLMYNRPTPQTLYYIQVLQFVEVTVTLFLLNIDWDKYQQSNEIHKTAISLLCPNRSLVYWFFSMRLTFF